MLRFVYLSIMLIVLLSCSTTKQNKPTTKETVYNPNLAVIQWDQQTIDLGKVKKGETRDLLYSFTNVGAKPLIIELVTACKCIDMDWPVDPVLPGEKAEITVTYDSTHQKLGQIKKTLDIIANTEPIIVEAFFTVDVIE